MIKNRINQFFNLLRLPGIMGAALIVLITGASYGQMNREATFKLLAKAMGPFTSDNGSAVYFEGLAFGIKAPLSIFTLPAYQVYRGGFLFSEGRKFEMQLGRMKGLSDGNLLVVVDESAKIMYVDSVRTVGLLRDEKAPDIGQLFKENIGDCDLEYDGKELVQKNECHKIKSVCKKGGHEVSVLYWIDAKTNQLVLMSEFQNGLYNVYWIRSTGVAPKTHSYAVRLPKKELEKFHGYEVFDHRYAGEKLNSKRN